MSTSASDLHRAARATDIGPGEARQVRIGERALALYNVDGTFYATDDTCTHAFALLSEGYIDGDIVECPLHQGCFHIPTGKAMGPPVIQDLRTYPVKVIDGEIYIEIPRP